VPGQPSAAAAVIPLGIANASILAARPAGCRLHEQADPALQERNVAYLQHALTAGEHPRLTELISQADQFPGLPREPQADLVGRYPDLIARVLTGLLGPALSRKCE
jgi:hypothetical protein